jgi:endonuclease G, mitochondrial
MIMKLLVKMLTGLALIAAIMTFMPSSGQAFNEEEQALIGEHCPWGLPSSGDILVRTGYITSYDEDRRIPLWSAYHIEPEYRNTPARKNRFSSFRKDKDVDDGVVTEEYTGLMSARGFARGHLAPYFAMGGDRDADGKVADLDTTVSDKDDEKTIFEANLMTNITPQHHYAFNGPGGIWYKVESYVREQLVDAEGLDVWVVAGCVLGPEKMEKTGKNEDIEVPPAFFQIVAVKDEDTDYPMVAAFLLPHHRERHGDIQDYLVSVDVVEALTGLDFFSELDDETEVWLEDADTFENWGVYFFEAE